MHRNPGRPPVQFFGGVDLAQNIQLVPVSAALKSRQFGIRQRGGDQQDGIRAMRSSLHDLVFVHDEIFAQTWKG